MTRGGHIQLVGHRHAFAVVQQGDGQVVGHALLIVGKQHVAAGGEVGLFHQLLQVLDSGAAEGGEILPTLEILLQPAAERVRTGLGMEETPGLALFGVVALVEVGKHVLDGGRLGKLGVAGMENCRCAVGFFVDQVDDAVTDRHRLLGWLIGERLASPKSRQVYRTIGQDVLRRVFRAPSDGPYAFFSRFRAIKLTKWVGRSGYFPVSVLVLPRLTPSLGDKRAFSICQVEPIPVSSIYNPDLRGYSRGCQAMTVGLDG
ncbi:hypothetical protein PS720_06463 [Pseudomonas fluorescens]|nr:hypothetical protein PS720_06463 [Pseudomonas fluorescens]